VARLKKSMTGIGGLPTPAILPAGLRRLFRWRKDRGVTASRAA